MTVVDDCTRECLAIEVDTSITGTRVKHVMNRLAEARGLPHSITVDNGPEFQGQVLDAWAYQPNVSLSFIRPGKPNENAYIYQPRTLDQNGTKQGVRSAGLRSFLHVSRRSRIHFFLAKKSKILLRQIMK